MAVENKRLNTRILLKYDTYTNWTSKNPVLLAGEVAIATIDTGDTQKVNSVTPPQVLIKVGDGNTAYNTLPFVSGLAADVYSWAKADKKPTYSASEITGLSEYIGSHGDTNTEYQVVAAKGEDGVAIPYSYQLQSRSYTNGVWGDWTDVTNGGLIDLREIDTRLDTLETDVDTLESNLAQEVTDRGNAITTAINALDSELSVTGTKDTDGLSIEIVQTDGKLASLNASIAAETYDKYGAASGVQSNLDKEIERAEAAEQANADAIAAEKLARENAFDALDYEYSGTPAAATEGTSISYVSSVSQTDGKIAVEKTALQFKSAYNPSTNKIATEKDVTDAVADLTGAMHFKGVVDALPEDVSDYENGDVIIVSSTKKEYVFSDGAFVELGNEDLGIQAVQALDVADLNTETIKVEVGEGVTEDRSAYTFVNLGQTDGNIHATPVKIQVAMDQVTGLNEAINNGGTKDGEQDERLTALETKATTIIGDDANKSMRQVATAVATEQINNLDTEDSEVEGQYVSAVSQADGKVVVSRKAIPTISHTDSTATASDAATITVITDIDASNHTITDTRVNNVVTKVGLDAAINALDSSIEVAASTDNKHYVLTGITETDGILTGKTDIAISDLALSGDVKDLKQTSDTYVTFYCGSATEVM